MSKTAVYYFSGTGNTLYIAKELAKALNGELIPIASTTGMDRVRPDADAIGIVYPVYYGDLPPIVKEFARKLSELEGKYIFAVANFGGSPGLSARNLRGILEGAGGALAAFYAIHMPQNAFKKFWESNKAIIRRSLKRVKKIAAMTSVGKRGVDSTGLLQRFIIPMHGRFEPLYRKKFAELTGDPPDTDFDTLIRRSDKCYAANDKCTGCGICVKVCPVGNIELDGGRPKWLGHCENCLACYNWCPNKAIGSRIPQKDYFYLNPRIKASEIMAQRH